MKNFIKNIVGRKFIQNVAIVSMGTGASQAVTILFAPILTRLYGPEIMGIQGVFMSMVGMAGVISGMGYPTAIVMPRSDRDAIGIIRISVYFGVITSILTYLLFYFTGDRLLSALNAKQLNDYTDLIPIAALLILIANIQNQWIIRNKAYKFKAKYDFITAIIVNITKSVAGFLNPTAKNLIYSNLIGGIINSVLIYYNRRKILVQNQKKNNNINIIHVIALIKKYRDFPLLRTPQNLINTFSQSLPVLLIASFFGVESSGQYTLALGVLALPAGLIGDSIAAVFYPKITDSIFNRKKSKVLIVKATFVMGILGIIPLIIITSFGPIIFSFVFGASWREAGVYAQWLSPFLFMQYLNKPSVSAIPALRLQGGLLIYELFSTGTKLLALYIGYSFYNDPIVAVGLFSGVGTLAYILLILWILRKA